VQSVSVGPCIHRVTQHPQDALERRQSPFQLPNGDTRGRATNDVNATPGAKLRAGHQKHHSAVGHLDSRPAPHYRQVFSRSIVNSSPVPSRCLAAPPHAGLRRRLVF
jgi:hypothetical protein